MSDQLGPASWFPHGEEETTELAETYTPSPLMISVDFNDLCVRYGVDEALVIVGKLKDLMG